MNSQFTSDGIGENAKGENKKSNFSLSTLLICIAVSVVISLLSGAGGAFVMYNKLIPESTTAIQTEMPESSTVYSEVTEENTVAGVNMQEEISSSEKVHEEETEEALSESTTNEENTKKTEELTTEKEFSKGDIYSEAVNSIVTITGLKREYYETILGRYHRDIQSNGTGFSVTEDGYIITNNHVVEGSIEITVTDYYGKEYSAKLVGSEPANDIAVIKIDAVTVAANLGSSSSLKVGDDIMIIGNALGELSYTFTDGIVSHLSRDVNLESGKTINMFQTNAAINNGNSGGPVYNMKGEVVGIASAKYASDKIEGLGFCIPIDHVKKMIADIILYGYVRGKPTLNMTLQTVTESMSSRYSMPTGCYVSDIETDSAAYKAGIRKGDVITKLGGKTVKSSEEVTEFLSDKKAGDKISITYWSKGDSTDAETNTKTITLDEITQ